MKQAFMCVEYNNADYWSAYVRTWLNKGWRLKLHHMFRHNGVRMVAVRFEKGK